MTTGGVPWYIDQDARHSPKTARFQAWMAARGQQGVITSASCKVSALSTPGAFVTVDPGGFVINSRATAIAFEAYADKFDSQLTLPVTPTPGASRTDLVILRVENPYAGGVGTGSWPIPADPVGGPYWQARVIEGVTPTNITDVTSWNNTWTALTLARIKRTNSSIVQAADITDLRSLVDLSGKRIIDDTLPPTSPPPIASQIYTNSIHFPTVTTFSHNTTAFTDWPAGGVFSVPIPDWAVECDIFGTFNPQYNNDTWGEFRFRVGSGTGNTTPTIMWDENVSADQAAGPGPQQFVIPLGGTWSIPSSMRGTVQPWQSQVHMLNPALHLGDLGTRNGVYLNLFINFKRYPY